MLQHIYIRTIQCQLQKGLQLPAFLPDSAPRHRSLQTQNVLQEKSINVLKWPWNIPNLKTIENCWEVLRTNVAEERHTSVQELIESIKHHWIAMNIAYFRKLSDSMPERIQPVLK